MNNIFSGSFTPMNNNMGLTCQPNFNGPQPGHCVFHHVNPAPAANFNHHISSAQNSAMAFMIANQAQEQQIIARLAAQQQAAKPAAKTPAPAPKPVSKSPERKPVLIDKEPTRGDINRAVNTELREIVRELGVDLKHLESDKTQIWNKLKAEGGDILDALESDLEKIKSMYAMPSFSIGSNFLSHTQQAQKNKEIAECEGGSQAFLCKIDKEAEWAIISLTQGTSFAAGIVAGVPAGLYETAYEIAKTASSPSEAYRALRALVESGNILDNVASAVQESWVDSIDRMEAEYQKGSISGSFNAGVEGGKLTTDIGGLVTGAAGLLKSSVVATKAVVKAASKAESAVKMGADIALPPASTSDRMAGYMAPKVVPDTSEAARLASQQALKSAQFMTMPPLENPFPGKALVERLILTTPQQTKVAEQLLDIGIKASITGITAITLKDVADRITADELNHITTLSSTGNHPVTGLYLSSLQDKYAPAHTGNPQLADTTLRNTGSNPPLVPQAPGHTGNNQNSGQGVTHTGNTAGVTDTGIKTTITPIPPGPSVDDLAYLAGGYKLGYTLNKNGEILGINGPTVPSKTLWMGAGKERVDVENPSPGKRAGQIHYQDSNNTKYYYDPITQIFPDAPRKVNEKLNDPAFKAAIEKGMKTYLGEK